MIPTKTERLYEGPWATQAELRSSAGTTVAIGGGAPVANKSSVITVLVFKEGRLRLLWGQEWIEEVRPAVGAAACSAVCATARPSHFTRWRHASVHSEARALPISAAASALGRTRSG